jgi:hypothetical protein
MVESTFSAFVADQSGAPVRAPRSAASWGAIIAGAFVAAGVTLILLALGSGLGFAATSPWPNAGISGMTLAVTAAIWLIITQWLSAAIGGYMAGRLRTRWLGTHAHEVFFRDTAHGLITWALASVLVAAIAGTGLLTTLGAAGAAATHAGPATAAAAVGAASPDTAYDIDRALRPSDPSAAPSAAPDPRPEVGRVIGNMIANGSIADADRAYLVQLVAARTGVPQDEAQRRVNELVSAANDAEVKVKAAAETARKAAAQASIYTALAMLIGAFIACVTAVVGGRLRDEHP